MTLWFFALILAFVAGVAVTLDLYGTWWPLLLFGIALFGAGVVLWKRVPVK